MSKPKPQGWRIADDVRARIARRVSEVSIQQVMAEFRVASGTVRKCRDEFGVAPRPHGQPRIWGELQLESADRRWPGWPLRPRHPAPLAWAA